MHLSRLFLNLEVRLRQLSEQRLGLFQVKSLESFGKPSVDFFNQETSYLSELLYLKNYSKGIIGITATLLVLYSNK